MATTGTLDLSIWRNDDVYEYPLRVIGPDLSQISVRVQVRLTPDAPGAPLIDLARVTNGNEQGIRLVGKPQLVDGRYINELRIRINKSTRQALPYAGEVGDAAALAWVLQINGRTRIVGRMFVLAHTMESDIAPTDRPVGYGASTASAPSAGATLSISSEDVAHLVIDGADLILSQVGAASEAAAQAVAAAAAATAAVAPVQEVIRTGGGRQLSRLKRRLTSILCQHTAIVFIGHSVLWGMTVPGMELIEPVAGQRTGQLTDPRNNATSPSAVNLIHAALGRTYYGDDSVTATPWPGSPNGYATFEYSQTVDLFPVGGFFTTSNAGSVGQWTVVQEANALTGSYLQASIGSSVDNLRQAFRFTGFAFDIVHARLADGAKVDVLVNGQKVGQFSTNTADTGGSPAFGHVSSVALGGYREDALIELRVVPGIAGYTLLRIEAVRVNRVLRVTNQGIIGRDTITYQPLLAAAVRPGDQTIFVMLDLNDRLQKFTPNGFLRELTKIVDTLQAAGKDVVLMASPAAINNAPPYNFPHVMARNIVAALADAKGCDFIDHFTPTARQLAAGDQSYMADDPHPGVVGQRDMSNRTLAAIEAATL